jgi:hypothetical protein
VLCGTGTLAGAKDLYPKTSTDKRVSVLHEASEALQNKGIFLVDIVY